MRVVEFVYSILDKHAPMNEKDRAELRRDAQTWYVTEQEKVKSDPENSTMKTKIFNVLEHWGFRTFLAVAYIWIQPVIQEYLEGGSDEDLDDEDD